MPNTNPNTNTEFAKEVIEILSSNSVQVNGRFFCLTHKQSFGRLADIILCLSQRIFKAGITSIIQ